VSRPTILYLAITTNPILQQILARGEGFGHRQHLELTWRCLEDHEPDAALAIVADAIRRVAAAHDATDKYHATITSGWVHCVAVHRERWPADSFERFIERNPALLDSKLLGHHFSRDLLACDEARSTVVDPDLRPLPALAG
jgi:hypothetical protein